MEFGSSLPVSRQCALLQVSRSSAYYTPNTSESAENLALMRRIDEQYLRTPFYGVPRMTWQLNQDGYGVNHKRVARLMSVMGLQATLPGPHTSRPRTEHVKYPYLLGGMKICGPCAYFGAIRSVISVSSAHPFRFIPISDFGHAHVCVSE